jgi:hypothetical protein
MWGWILDHLRNPELVRQFEWDARKIQRFDGKEFTPAYTEPWTGRRWWEIQVWLETPSLGCPDFFQSALPNDAKMVCLEIYADKSVLSSFGTAKAYPVMARIANLPTRVRHGEGVGGTQIVGWLPVVSLEHTLRGTQH